MSIGFCRVFRAAAGKLRPLRTGRLAGRSLRIFRPHRPGLRAERLPAGYTTAHDRNREGTDAMTDEVKTTEVQKFAALREFVENAETGFPRISSKAYTTERGTPYLRAPGVALIAKPDVNIHTISDFLGGFA